MNSPSSYRSNTLFMVLSYPEGTLAGGVPAVGMHKRDRLQLAGFLIRLNL
jgi:hypothetical protein